MRDTKAEVSRLWVRGEPLLEISRELNCTPGTVRTYLAETRADRGSDFRSIRTFGVPGMIYEGLWIEARERDVGLNALVQAILFHVVRDNLVGAILDDGKEESRK